MLSDSVKKKKKVSFCALSLTNSALVHTKTLTQPQTWDMKRRHYPQFPL